MSILNKTHTNMILTNKNKVKCSNYLTGFGAVCCTGDCRMGCCWTGELNEAKLLLFEKLFGMVGFGSSDRTFIEWSGNQPI